MQELPKVLCLECASVRRRMDMSERRLQAILDARDANRVVADPARNEVTLSPNLPEERTHTQRGERRALQCGTGTSSDESAGGRDQEFVAGLGVLVRQSKLPVPMGGVRVSIVWPAGREAWRSRHTLSSRHLSPSRRCGRGTGRVCPAHGTATRGRGDGRVLRAASRVSNG